MEAALHLRSVVLKWPGDREFFKGLAAHVALIDGVTFFIVLALLSGVSSVGLGGRVVEMSGGWPLLAAVGAGVVVVACFVVTVVILYPVERLLIGISRRSQPEACMFFAAALVFSQMVDRTPGGRGLPTVRSIEVVAGHLYGGRRIRRFRDRASQAVFEDRFVQAAAAVRATALWAALPNAGTSASLRTFYANLMRTVLDGAYGDLPTVPPRANVTQRARSRVVLGVLRSIAVAVLPGACLLAWQSLQGPIPAPTGHALTTVVSAWGVLMLLGLVDPHLRERIELVKDVAAIFYSKP